MDVLDKIKAPVAIELEQFNEAFRQTLYADNPLLEKAVEHLLKAPGKQLRPLLVLLSAKMVGKVSDKVINVALALEMLHTASLVHDDVVDESNRRRGLPSLNAFLSNQAAVLAGDGKLDIARCPLLLGQPVQIHKEIHADLPGEHQ